MFNTQNLSESLHAAYVQATTLARRTKAAFVNPEHLLLACLLREGNLWRVVKEAGLDVNYIINRLQRETSQTFRTENDTTMSPILSTCLERAYTEAKFHNRRAVEEVHFLSALLLSDSGSASTMLRSMRLTPNIVDDLSKKLQLKAEETQSTVSFERNGSNQAPAKVVSDAPWLKELNVPTLAACCTDLSRSAHLKQFTPFFGREEELRRVMQTMMRRYKNSLIVVGEVGVGKNALIESFAHNIVNGDVPEKLRNTAIYKLDLNALYSSTMLSGALEERLKKLLGELEKNRIDAIFYISEVHLLFTAYSQLLTLLEPKIARGDIRIIGTCTPQMFKKHLEGKSSLESYYITLNIEEPDIELTTTIIRGLKPYYEKFHNVRIEDSAVKAAVQYAKRYINGRFLPDKAIDLIDAACAQLRIQLDAAPMESVKAAKNLEQVKLEIAALESQSSRSSKENKRLEELLRQKDDLRDNINESNASYAKVRRINQDLARLYQERSQAEEQLSKFEQASNYSAAGELKYGVLIDLKSKIQALEEERNKLGTKVESSVSTELVADAVSSQTGIPLSKMVEDEKQKLLKIEEKLSERVIGQSQAVKQIASAVRRSRTGLQDPKRPIGSFIFLGPSGVGKTELAKTLAEFLFDDENAVVRLDMSEFMEKHAVSRLIGAPPGYVGHDDGGVLTNAVREKPYSVVLFDEVEKAHVDIFNVLLQMLDDGRLTDSKGQVVDFKNTIVIMTSNLGSKLILENINDNPDSIQQLVMGELEKHFRPEFLGRIDGKIVFNPLSKDNIRDILHLQMRRIHALLSDRDLTMKLDKSAVEFLVERGYVPAFGARPVKKAIVDYIQEPLSNILLEGRFPEGSTIHVTYIPDGDDILSNDVLTFGKEVTEKPDNAPVASALESIGE